MIVLIKDSISQNRGDDGMINDMQNRLKKDNNKKMRDFYDKTQENQTAGRRELKGKVNKNGPKTEASPEWHYKVGAFALSLAGILGILFIIQYLSMGVHNLTEDTEGSFFQFYALTKHYWLILITFPGIWWYTNHRLRAIWRNNNAMYLTDDIEGYENDSYVQTPVHIVRNFDAAPDTGLGFDGHVSAIVSHMMIDNKGIKKIDMPKLDPDAEGQVMKDDNGKVVTQKKEMFDKEFGIELFNFSNVSYDNQHWYSAPDFEHNPKASKKEQKIGNMRQGFFGQKEHETLADYINAEFYPLDTEVQRPAGVYFYDSRPVNTILIAITRGGKGQTYIEPIIDLWTREKQKWNVFATDPKGELLAKFYYPAAVRGMDVVQFNLMHPHLTNVFNPLINAIQQFRRNDPTKGTAIIDTIITTLFPDNGEIWNPAAGNMFRRAVYMLFDYYIEQEKYLRYIGHRDEVAQEVIDQEIDRLYSKVTLFNVYSLIGDLASKVSKDESFINVNPEQPPVTEKNLLTLMFDAMAMLPINDLRSKAITANNAVKQVASAEQTIAGIYATLLTGLSVYADDTAIALMSGGVSESFDITGLGFPRRFGVKFDDFFIKKFKISDELCTWTIYRDPEMTDRYEGSDFQHEEKLPPSGWTWGHFKGIFDQEVVYLRLTLSSGRTVIKEFNFRFTKGYKTLDSISHVIDPITKDKTVLGGTMEEWNVKNQDVEITSFEMNSFDYASKTYRIQPVPILASTQVYYTEKPKFIFAITPPHLQVYQKHILVIIKQILDEQYSNSYVTKSDRKPIVGTRMLLEEFGNIRSGENGIPDIDTATSIALGQDVQMTFVLQSFQQLRAIYSEDVEKIIRSNSSHTIFLKSNDEELINDLVRTSGARHEFRGKSKSVSRKQADIITTSEPTVNFSGELKETTALTANDFLFLAGKSPGNSITLISGEMPIVNKLDTITPMAAGLHKKLPQQRFDKDSGTTENYSDSTMPTRHSIGGANYLDNVINGEKLVQARVEQAKIAQKIKKDILEVGDRHGVEIGIENGELSELMMNFVYEEYEKQKGTNRQDLGKPVEYHEIAQKLSSGIMKIRDQSLSKDERLLVASNIRETLVKCVLDENLDNLTQIYRDDKADNVLGYKPESVANFAGQMIIKYPKPVDLDLEKVDIDEMAKKNEDLDIDDPFEEKAFDMYNHHHIDALEHVMVQLVDGEIEAPSGVRVRKTDDDSYEMSINETFIISYQIIDDSYMFTINENYSLANKYILENEELVGLLLSVIADNE